MIWGQYIYVFFLAHVKFLFAASIAEVTTDLTFLEIAITSTTGAISCFNIFYFISMSIYHGRAKSEYIRKMRFKKKKKIFKKRNRWIIKLKMSKGGFYILCFLAPVFLSIPIGTFVVVKFFGKVKFTYIYVTIVLAFASLFLAYFNHFIFD